VDNRYSILVTIINIADIEKALKEKKPNIEEELRASLLLEVHDLIPLFLS
jgi:hypothetical protein